MEQDGKTELGERKVALLLILILILLRSEASFLYTCYDDTIYPLEKLALLSADSFALVQASYAHCSSYTHVPC